MDDCLEGLVQLVDVDYLQGEEEHQVETAQCHEEVDDGFHLYLATLRLLLTQVVP